MENKVWLEKDIRQYMNCLSNTTGYIVGKHIPIRISKRMTRALGCKYAIYKNDRLTLDSFVFSSYLVNGYIPENYVKDIIRHEFAHAWADEGKAQSCDHCGEFIKKCKILKCEYRSEAGQKVSDMFHESKRFVSAKRGVGTKLICNKCGKDYVVKETIASEIDNRYRCGCCNDNHFKKYSLPMSSEIKLKEFVKFISKKIDNISIANVRINIKGDIIKISFKDKFMSSWDRDYKKCLAIIKKTKCLLNYAKKIEKNRVYNCVIECKIDVENLDLLKL